MNTRAKRRLVLVVRVFLVGVAAALLVFGGICVKAACEIHREVDEMQRPLVEMAVDLSRAGTYSATMPPVREYFHGIGLHVEIETVERDEGALERLFEGVSGAAKVTDGEGKVVCALPLADDQLMCYPAREESDARAWATFLDTVPEYAGEGSVLMLEIDRPAEALAGVPQKLIARYNLCGLESLNSLIVSGLGAVSVALGLVACGLALVPLIRRKKRTLVNCVAQGSVG